MFLTDLRRIGPLLICLLASSAAFAQKFYTYVGDTGPEYVLLAWGTTLSENSIGRSSPSHGRAVVRLGGQELTVTDKNYVIVRNLQPNTEYDYEVTLGGRKIGQAKIRTWPAKSEKLRFFVMGDFGSGDAAQKQVADAMWADFQKNWGDNPVRFVITTGDNLYGTLGLTLRFRDTGNKDTDWGAKFFRPYEPVIARIPFYPSLGNHDGNETESRDDLSTYLDNFFFPRQYPGPILPVFVWRPGRLFCARQHYELGRRPAAACLSGEQRSA